MNLLFFTIEHGMNYGVQKIPIFLLLGMHPMIHIKKLILTIIFLSTSSLHSMEQMDYPETDEGFLDLSQLSQNSTHRSSHVAIAIEEDPISPSVSPRHSSPTSILSPSPNTIAQLAQASSPILMHATSPLSPNKEIDSPASSQITPTQISDSTLNPQMPPKPHLTAPAAKKYIASIHALHPIFAARQTDPEISDDARLQALHTVFPADPEIIETFDKTSMVQRHNPTQSYILQPITTPDHNNGKTKEEHTKKKCCLCCIL